jgi:3-dehydroquinate dehydratase
VSDIAKACRGTLAGFGVYGYHMALRGLQELKK